MVYYIVGIKSQKDLSDSKKEKYYRDIKRILGYLGVNLQSTSNFCEIYREELNADSCFHVEDVKLPAFLKMLTKPSRRDSLDKIIIKTIG